MSKLPNLNLEQVLPENDDVYALNVCRNPDCINFTERPQFGRPHHASKQAASAKRNSNSFGRNVGDYRMEASRNKNRHTFAISPNPLEWQDGRNLICNCCNTKTTIVSEHALREEIERLSSMNGVLSGPACPGCGKYYFGAPHEFKFNGKNGDGQRLIHQCDTTTTKRFTVSQSHVSQRKRESNHQILNMLINGAGFRDVVRMLASGKDKKVGFSRIYNRLFWLEEVLLAYEKDQLEKWRNRIEKAGHKNQHRLATDALVLSVNWETSEDRRVTMLQCTATADADSGYVYRIDTNFDPNIDPVEYFDREYVRNLKFKLSKRYTKKSGASFNYPLLEFQRPTARFQEPLFFASALHHVSLFIEQKLPHMIDKLEAAQYERILDRKKRLISRIYYDYYDIKQYDRDHRAPFTGTLISETYTEAAHLALVKELLPPGSITLMTDAASSMVRHVPLIFANEIKQDEFEWLAVHLANKQASKPTRLAAIKTYKEAFVQWMKTNNFNAPIEVLRPKFVSEYMTQAKSPNDSFKGPGFASSLWINTPVQTGYEVGKSVGILVAKKRVRKMLHEVSSGSVSLDLNANTTAVTKAKASLFRDEFSSIIDASSLQAVDTFFNSVRERLSPTGRTGGGASMTGTYVQGNSFNPRVLTALLNIFRVSYNFFELRPFEKGDGDPSQQAVQSTTTHITVPGTNKKVAVKGRPRKVIEKRTPAMRHGIQQIQGNTTQQPPDVMKILYQPWLYAGTPLWDKLSTHDVDGRTRKGKLRKKRKM
ncbi:MAG: hypothetical protein OQK24_11800 [Magnetovibrio sp.]|nr:hypothetical protein [Magnetovibrio sp.]